MSWPCGRRRLGDTGRLLNSMPFRPIHRLMRFASHDWRAALAAIPLVPFALRFSEGSSTRF